MEREHRWINVTELVAELHRALPESAANDEALLHITTWAFEQPEQPPLVGVTEASKIIGVPKPRIMRFRAQGRLPDPITVDGPSAPVYLRNEIEDFAAAIRYVRRQKRQPKQPKKAATLIEMARAIDERAA